MTRHPAPPLAAALVAGVLAMGCGPEARRPETGRTATLETFDSLLVELGGVPSASMTRAERWRLISSTWTGLPPATYNPDNLPEPDSRGASLLQAYCVQCHWLPAPQMHSAEEWPLLVRRMLLRARTLPERMGGPLTRELLGADSALVEGFAFTNLPSPADADSLIRYLREHALPVAEAGEVGNGPLATAYRRACENCHQLPDPDAHTFEEWETVLARMRGNMAAMKVPVVSEATSDSVLRYLRSAAGG